MLKRLVLLLCLPVAALAQTNERDAVIAGNGFVLGAAGSDRHWQATVGYGGKIDDPMWIGQASWAVQITDAETVDVAKAVNEEADWVTGERYRHDRTGFFWQVFHKQPAQGSDRRFSADLALYGYRTHSGTYSNWGLGMNLGLGSQVVGDLFAGATVGVRPGLLSTATIAGEFGLLTEYDLDAKLTYAWSPAFLLHGGYFQQGIVSTEAEASLVSLGAHWQAGVTLIF
ncbi:hypothetical protein [Salinibius halmophilus]|uniref:hypothetical protein n=1 Tax=Salinibius halmophilus TaxID=1853216 RepID=UPI000E6756CB|nr:hypothetical protein [Salinibius halmophilus]